MKKAAILLIVVFISTTASFAQKVAYIDMKYILSNIPDYIEAQKKVDAQSEKWQAEIKDKYDAIDKMNRDFQGQQVLMSDDMKKQKQDDIDTKEKEAKELQTQYFGYNGQLFKLRQQLVKPVQDKVYDAVQKVATNKNYDFIFDKSEGVYLMYTNPKLDVSEQVLDYLGYSSRTKPEGDQNKSKFPSINLDMGNHSNSPSSPSSPSSNPSPKPQTTPPSNDNPPVSAPPTTPH